MSDDVIGEIIQLLENKLDQLKPELVNKIEERAKARKTFSELRSELFSVPFWKKLLMPFLEERVKRKLERLKWEIPGLEEKIEHYQEAIVHLKQGIHSPAIRLLKQLAFVACLGNVRGTKCVEISELIEQFTALQKGGEKGQL